MYTIRSNARTWLFLFFSGITRLALAQDSLTASMYIDTYYQSDAEGPLKHDRPFFIYNYKHSNEINVNLALLRFVYTGNRFTARLGLMAGTYPRYNLAHEHELLRYVYEANIGYKFSRRLSVDMGVLPSHIGLESAIAKENMNVGRSIMADNSPYYEAGIRLTYALAMKWTAAILILNGWQNIKETNSDKALGTQVQYRPKEGLLFNSSTFIGNEKPDSAKKQLRMFHNFYVTYDVNEKVALALLFDYGVEQKHAAPGFNPWLGTAMMAGYKFTKKMSVAARIEYFSDRHAVVVRTPPPFRFETIGYSFNFNYNLTGNILLRLETRLFRASDKIFGRANVARDTDISSLVTLAYSF